MIRCPFGDHLGASWMPFLKVSWRTWRPLGSMVARCSPVLLKKSKAIRRPLGDQSLSWLGVWVSRCWCVPSGLAAQILKSPSLGSNRVKVIRPFSRRARAAAEHDRPAQGARPGPGHVPGTRQRRGPGPVKPGGLRWPGRRRCRRSRGPRQHKTGGHAARHAQRCDEPACPQRHNGAGWTFHVLLLCLRPEPETRCPDGARSGPGRRFWAAAGRWLSQRAPLVGRCRSSRTNGSLWRMVTIWAPRLIREATNCRVLASQGATRAARDAVGDGLGAFVVGAGA